MIDMCHFTVCSVPLVHTELLQRRGESESLNGGSLPIMARVIDAVAELVSLLIIETLCSMLPWFPCITYVSGVIDGSVAGSGCLRQRSWRARAVDRPHRGNASRRYFPNLLCAAAVVRFDELSCPVWAVTLCISSTSPPSMCWRMFSRALPGLDSYTVGPACC